MVKGDKDGMRTARYHLEYSKNLAHPPDSDGFLHGLLKSCSGSSPYDQKVKNN